MLGNTNITIKPNEKVDFVDWIESTGTQWIDTETIPELGYKAEIKFQATVAPTSSESWIYGVWATEGYRCGLTTSGFDISRGFTYSQTSNYTEITTAIGENNTQDYSISAYLFSQNENGTAMYTTGSKYKLYYCKIYSSDNVLIRNFKPCKDSAGIFCLYDTVTKKYFYNKGTGYFEGPNPKQVEYIESNGTQYIDSNYVPTETTKIEGEVSIIDTRTSTSIWPTFWGAQSLTDGSDGKNFAFGYTPSTKIMYGFEYVIGTKYEIKMSVEDGYNINGTKYKDYIWGGSPGVSLGIFTRKCGNVNFESTMNGIARIYGLKIYEENVLIYNFIPVYIGIYCLYDTINQKYYYNKGTGLFGGEYISAKTTVLMHYEGNTTNETKMTSHSTVGTISYGDGKVGGKSLKLNGSSCIKIPYSDPIIFGSSDFTIAGWFKQTNVDGGGSAPRLWSHQYRYSSSYTYYGLKIEINATSRNIYCCCQTAYNSQIVVSSGKLMPVNEWIHLALVRKGTIATLYINGIASGSATISGSLYQNSSATFKIGAGTNESASNDNPQNYFVGEIDEFIIVKEALWDSNFVPPKHPYGSKEFYNTEI